MAHLARSTIVALLFWSVVSGACGGKAETSAPVSSGIGGGAQLSKGGAAGQGAVAGSVGQAGTAGGGGSGGGPTQGGQAGAAGGGGSGGGPTQGGKAGNAGIAGSAGQGGQAVCDSDTPIAAAGLEDTGFARCADGTLHRKAIVTCGNLVPRPGKCQAQGSPQLCIMDADCPAPYGHCDAVYQNPVLTQCQCLPGCTSDSECGAGRICECADPVGRCVEAACTSDADCPGSMCQRNAAGTCGFGLLYRCAQPQDACSSDQDCPGPQICTVTSNGAECVPICVG